MDYLETSDPFTCPEKPRQSPRSAYLDDPDVQLMLRVQHGDEGAFTELRERYVPRIFGYFCRLLRDRASAEDLTQEVFLRLYRARQTYRPRARFSTWATHVTQNVARNAIRSRRRHNQVASASRETPSGQRFETLFVDHNGPPSRSLERAELARAVREAVAELAQRQRVAIQMHQFEGRTYAEVAAELDMTPAAIKSLLYRARVQLRQALLRFAS